MLLFVHPSGHLNDAVVPAGSIAAVNAVRGEKLGRYAIELSRRELARAKVIAIDLHWALALPGVEALVRRARETAPNVPIVLGGLSASLFARRLLEEGVADFVVQGDFEPGFAPLVETLLEGRTPGPLPNVWTRGDGAGWGARAPALSRATQQAHDASSSVLAEWFPSYERLQALTARAVSHDRTIAVARGCAMSCPGCHGSSQAAVGSGVLLRSPESVVREVERAASAETRHLVLLFGKLAGRSLREHATALARAVPWAIREHVGVFCCQPPDEATLRALLVAFPCKIGISAVEPGEHEPAPSADALVREMAAWRCVADLARREARLELVLWSSSLERCRELRRALGADDERVRVSWSGAWHMLRPIAKNAGSDFDAVRRAVKPFFTFGLARALSPSLARVLLPFGFLDELPGEPVPHAGLGNRLATFTREASAGFSRHRLPTLPSLALVALPVEATGITLMDEERSSCGPGSVGQRRVRGDLVLSAPGSRVTTALARARRMRFHRDERGATFRARVALRSTELLAVVPAPPDGELDHDWLETLCRDGIILLARARGSSASAEAVYELEVRAAFDAVLLSLRNGAKVVARGWSDGGLFLDRHPLELGVAPCA